MELRYEQAAKELGATTSAVEEATQDQVSNREFLRVRGF